MPPALQLPRVERTAERTGRRLFRKQVLPLATVKHPDQGDIHFTAERLRSYRDAFVAGAMDQVPFSLVDGQNRHNDDPLRFMGEVKSLDVVYTDDPREVAENPNGLYATIETTETGAKLLEDNPNLPVSVRIKTLDDGREVLAHVAGTHDPVAKGMSPWQVIDASDNAEVCDLSAQGCYTSLSMADTETPPQGTGSESEALSTEEVGRFRAFLQRFGNGDNPPAATSAQEPAEADDALTDLLNSLDTDPANEQEPEPVALSNTDPATIELTQRVERAEVRAGTAELANRLSGYLDAGVPPTLINAAKAQLLGESDEHKAIAIDFANGREPAAAKALFAVLDGAKGTIDFTEKGSSDTSTEDEGRKAKLDAWEAHSG